MNVTRFRVFVLAAIVALIAFVAIAVVTLSIVGGGSHSTPAITTLTGLVVPTVVALLALLRGEQTNEKVNGHMKQLTELAVQGAAQSGDTELVQKAEQAQVVTDTLTNGPTEPR